MTARLPLLWGVGAVIASLIGPTDAPLVGFGSGDPDVILVQDGWHLALPIALAFGVFAVVYGLMPTKRFGMVRYRLGLAHLFLMAIGAVLIALPQRVLAIRGLPSDSEVAREFAIWNVVSSAGYVAMALSVLVFGAVLVEMIFTHREKQT